jgi:hypothetical protein
VIDGRFLAPLPGIADGGAHDMPASAVPGHEVFPACQDITLDARTRKSVFWRLTQHVSSSDALSGSEVPADPGVCFRDFVTIHGKSATACNPACLPPAALQKQ